MGISPDTKYEYWHMCLLKECACAEDTPPTDRLLTKSEIEKHLETTHEINFKNIGSNWDINLFEILILYEETNVVADNIGKKRNSSNWQITSYEIWVHKFSLQCPIRYLDSDESNEVMGWKSETCGHMFCVPGT